MTAKHRPPQLRTAVRHLASDTQLVAMAIQLANAAVLCQLQRPDCKVTLGGWTWWDTRPMLDEREHSAPTIDMTHQSIDYALAAGLVMRHPTQPHLLHILAAPDRAGMDR